MKVFVLISTIDEGILHIPAILHYEDIAVKYIVVWQQTDDFKKLYRSNPAYQEALLKLIRHDVCLKEMDGRGLCRSRNKALEMAALQEEDGICLLADDDEIFSTDAFETIARYYQENHDIDVALFRVLDFDGQPLKQYPAKEIDFSLRDRRYYPSSHEITFRKAMLSEGYRFDERFGLGSERLAAGEEDIWLHEAQRHGKHIRLVPKVIASTDAHTTGMDVLNVKVLRSKGAVYGVTMSKPKAWLRTIREVIGIKRRYHASFFHLYKNIWTGVKYVQP